MAETWKRPVMIGVKCDLIERAEALNLDIPEITERALDEAIATETDRRSRSDPSDGQGVGSWTFQHRDLAR